jgi:hypothetical protein
MPSWTSSSILSVRVLSFLNPRHLDHISRRPNPNPTARTQRCWLRQQHTWWASSSEGPRAMFAPCRAMALAPPCRHAAAAAAAVGGGLSTLSVCSGTRWQCTAAPHAPRCCPAALSAAAAAAAVGIRPAPVSAGANGRRTIDGMVAGSWLRSERCAPCGRANESAPTFSTAAPPAPLVVLGEARCELRVPSPPHYTLSTTVPRHSNWRQPAQSPLWLVRVQLDLQVQPHGHHAWADCAAGAEQRAERRGSHRRGSHVTHDGAARRSAWSGFSGVAEMWLSSDASLRAGDDGHGRSYGCGSGSGIAALYAANSRAAHRGDVIRH